MWKGLISFLAVVQIMAPLGTGSVLLAQVNQADGKLAHSLIAGLKGEVTVTPFQKGGEGYVPKFRSELYEGDLITTGEESVVEVLAPDQGLITLQELSEATVDPPKEGQLHVTMNVGAAEISSFSKGAEGSSALIVQTPYTKARAMGALVTVEVQTTVEGTVYRPGSHSPFPYLVRAKFPAQTHTPANLRTLERYCVLEGQLDIQHQTTNKEEVHLILKEGQCSRFADGVKLPTGETSAIIDWRSICAVGHHCDIPENADELIAEKQMKQALALEQALTGSDPDNEDVDEQVILATTGTLLASADGGLGPGTGPGNPILPCTGNSQLCAAPDPNVGGTPPSTGGGGGGGEPSPGNIQTIGNLLPVGGISGGPGLLAILNSDFSAEKELVRADSGFRGGAPHLGSPPLNTLVISSLTPNGDAPISNRDVPLEFPSFNRFPTSQVQLGTESAERLEQAQQLAQFARSSSINPDNIFGSVPEGGAAEPCQSLIECFEIILALGKQGTFQNPDPDGGIDGAIVVRSSSTFDPLLGLSGASREVTLKSGAVLVDTRVAIPGGQALISIEGTPGEPAILSMEDRALAILDGSAIQPLDNGPALIAAALSAVGGSGTALLSIVDGTLQGPQEPPVIGTDGNGVDIVRNDIPPLIEMIDGAADVHAGFSLSSTANAGQTGELDQALLEASAPILGMIRSTFLGNGDFGSVEGQNAKLIANLAPGDALVRVDASSFMVNGNLFTVTNGGQLLLNGGSLLSVTGDGSATIQGGVLVSVGADSLFSVGGGGSLINFGTGTNTVNISNSLCNGGGCFAPFDNPAWQVAGDASDFSAPAGYDPFLDVGTFSDGSVNTLNITPGSAVLEVQTGGTIQIQ